MVATSGPGSAEVAVSEPALSHTVGITHRCPFKTPFQSLLHPPTPPQAALACATSPPGARGTVTLQQRSTMQVSASVCTMSWQRGLTKDAVGLSLPMPSPETRLWLGSGATPTGSPNFLQWGGNLHQRQSGHSLTLKSLLFLGVDMIW